MNEFRLESYPAAESYRLLDFDSVDVSPGTVNETWILTVRGTAPCTNMEVALSPRIYIRCPEFWEIEVVGHLPNGVCIRGTEEYTESIELTGVTGSVGIEVIGATRTEQREVPGGCRGSDDISSGGDKPGERFIVVALTGSSGSKHQGCSVVRDGDPYLAIYSQVFGPASRGECEAWISDNCGFDPGDPPE
jgi:hypothetical protein